MAINLAQDMVKMNKKYLGRYTRVWLYTRMPSPSLSKAISESTNKYVDFTDACGPLRFIEIETRICTRLIKALVNISQDISVLKWHKDKHGLIIQSGIGDELIDQINLANSKALAHGNYVSSPIEIFPMPQYTEDTSNLQSIHSEYIEFLHDAKEAIKHMMFLVGNILYWNSIGG